MKKLLLFAITLILVSCGTDDTTRYYETIFTQNQLPENIPFGSSKKDIIIHFDSTYLAEQGPQLLFFDFPLKNNDSYTLACKFYNDSLYGLEVGIFTQDVQTGNELYAKIISAFNASFHQHKTIDPKQHVWYYHDDKTQTNVEIEARNESKKFGVLTVLFNDVEF